MDVGIQMIFATYGWQDMPDHQAWDEEIRLARLAADLGFDCLWAVEHHFADYSFCPDNFQALTHLAALCPNIDIGTAAVILPWNNPLRVAEKAIVLDMLSGGRLRLGMGRGLARREFAAFNQTMDQSRERFDEASAMIVQAVKTGWIEGDGKYYPQPKVELRPRPKYDLSDRIYAVASSDDSLSSAARLGARRLPTGKAAVLFAPEVARGFIGHFIGAISGGSQYRKTTFLLGAAGEQVFPSWVQMHERPHLRKGIASTAWDSEGVRTRDRELVRDGLLDGYLLGSYSARKLGLATTGNAGGLHNLLVDPSEGAPDAAGLLRRMGRGLLVTELMGQGVNGVTGDYSRGATGFWVEGGEIAFPVHEVTIAGNLKDLYRNVVAIGGDIDLRGGIRMGSLLLEEMTIAGE